MDDSKIWGIFFITGLVLGCIVGGIFGNFAMYEDHFKHGYGQAIIDARDGNPPRYKLFHRGDGTITWIKNNAGVRIDENSKWR